MPLEVTTGPDPFDVAVDEVPAREVLEGEVFESRVVVIRVEVEVTTGPLMLSLSSAVVGETTHSVDEGASGDDVSVTRMVGMLDPVTSEGTIDLGSSEVVSVVVEVVVSAQYVDVDCSASMTSKMNVIVSVVIDVVASSWIRV